jgi:hypothetical protein
MFALLSSYAKPNGMENPDPIDLLFARAKEFGIPMSAICDEAGVAQSTPSRWKVDPDSAKRRTIRKLEEALDRIILFRRKAA